MFSFAADRVRQEFLSAEQYQSCCEIVWSRDRRAGPQPSVENIPPRAKIYAKADHYLPLLRRLVTSRSRVVLVTAESDITITPEIARLAPAQVFAWFSTNAIAPGVAALPLGLGNSYCDVTSKAPALAGHAADPARRNKWLYVNFRTGTNPAARVPAMEYFRGQPGDWLTVREGGVAPGEFLREMSGHRFVFCPAGHGVDTHRLWEALYTRTIPVVVRHPALAAFEDLPILFVDDFRRATKDFLEQNYQRMCAATWNEEKLFLPWWRKKFADAAQAMPRPRVSLLAYLAHRLGVPGVVSRINRELIVKTAAG